MVVDSHTHAWGAPSAEYPWTNGWIVEDFVSAFDTHIVFNDERLIDDLDEVGIDEAVVVGYPINEWSDNQYTIEAAVENDRLYGVAMIDHLADDGAETLRHVMSQDGMLGFRLGAICPYDEMWQAFDYETTWLQESIDETEYWEAATETDALVQIMAHTGQLDQVLELVETYPDLPYALDHFCHADVETPPEEAYPHATELADHDRVAMKISEVSILSNEGYPYEDTYDHLRWLLDTFGRERIVWGSDWPNVNHPESGGMSFDETLSWLDHVPFLTDRDREWFTGRAFEDLVGL